MHPCERRPVDRERARVHEVRPEFPTWTNESGSRERVPLSLSGTRNDASRAGQEFPPPSRQDGVRIASGDGETNERADGVRLLRGSGKDRRTAALVSAALKRLGGGSARGTLKASNKVRVYPQKSSRLASSRPLSSLTVPPKPGVSTPVPPTASAVRSSRRVR